MQPNQTTLDRHQVKQLEDDLRNALYATNRALTTLFFDETNRTEYDRLVANRDELFRIGVALYGWRD